MKAITFIKNDTLVFSSYFWRLLTILVAIGLSLVVGYNVTGGKPFLSLAIVGFLFYLGLIRIDPFVLFTGWMVISPLFQAWNGIEFGRGIPNLNFDRLGALVLITILVLKGFSGQLNTNYKVSKIDLGLVLYFVVRVVLVLLKPTNLVNELFDVFQINGIPLVAYFLVRLLVTNEYRLTRFTGSLLISIIYLVAGAFYEEITWIPIVKDSGTGYINAGAFRAGSFLTAPWALGLVLAMYMPFCIYQETRARSENQRLFYLFIWGTIMITLPFTFIRSVWLAVSIQLVLIYVLFKAWRKRLIILLIIIVVFIAIFWPKISSSKLYTDQIGNLGNFIGRAKYAEYQWGVFEKNWLIGIGGGQGRIVQTAHGYVYPAHNTILVLLVDAGVLGNLPLFLSALGFVILTLRTYQVLPEFHHGRSIIATIWTAGVAYLVVGSAIDITYFLFPVVVLYMIIGMGISVSQIYSGPGI